MIYTHIPKRKAKKPDARTRELRANWQEILDKYDIKPTVTAKKKSSRPMLTIQRQTTMHPSLDTNSGSTGKKDIPIYTGDSMIGISTLHKSNQIPVFRQQDAIDVAKMRRG